MRDINNQLPVHSVLLVKTNPQRDGSAIKFLSVLKTKIHENSVQSTLLQFWNEDIILVIL